MKERFHCEFNDCYCHHFVKDNNNLCANCHHSKIWHSKKDTQDFLSFVSPRKAARSAEYTHVFPIQVAIFIPEAVAIPIEENINYCTDIDLLPI